MSLEKYRRERLVIQNPKTPVYDAARAMGSNHIGLVVVADHGQIVGILTDRDIALRVVGFQLDPTTTALEEVMTPDPAILPIDATEQQALELMRDRHVRRIPVVEDGEMVGLVTLDDLNVTLPQLQTIRVGVNSVGLADTRTRVSSERLHYPEQVRDPAGGLTRAISQ